MRSKCVIGVLLVTAISLVSVVAFAFSFTGTAAEEKGKGEAIIEAAVSGECMATSAPTAFPVETENAPTNTETETVESSKILGMDCAADESYLLAKIAMAEAEGEDTEGKALVMLVVLNRVQSDGFPDSIEEVIFQKHQFSPVSNGRFDRVEPDEDCYRALKLIQIEKWDKSRGATYFESKSDSTWHSRNLKFLFRHGNHYFYRDKE